MTNDEIIQGLQFTIDMFLFDPFTGESLTEPRNDDDKITIDACREAIAVLRAQPCEDVVSREAVLDALHVSGRPTKRFDYVIEVQRDIKALPPVTPKSRWIPVSERLPNEEIKPKGHGVCNVLVTYKWGGVDRVNQVYYAGGKFRDPMDCDKSVNEKVTAWMYLPEPYKAESEE